MKFNDLKEVLSCLDGIDYPMLFAIEDMEWCLSSDDYIHHVDVNGTVYGGELPEGFERSEDYLICNIDTGCGQWITSIFDVSKELSYEDFELKYGDQM